MATRLHPPMTPSAALAERARALAHELEQLQFHTPSHVYNPLIYAWDGHQQFLQRFGNKMGRVLLLGMNPGPWGMAQTGVPFGSIPAVRDWFHIQTTLTAELPEQHAKYPIRGMDCHREEGSGKRLWGWAAQRMGSAEAFFDRFFIVNYCPLLFIGKNRNMIPSALTAGEHDQLEARCAAAFADMLQILQPTAIVALGRYAEKQARRLVGKRLPVIYLLHPSPANPKANRHWAEYAEAALGPWLPPPPEA